MICVEVEQCRLSKLVATSDRTIRAVLEYKYNISVDSLKENQLDNAVCPNTENSSKEWKRYRSKDEVVTPGATFLVPKHKPTENSIEDGYELCLKFFYADKDSNKNEIIGKCQWNATVLQKLVNFGSQVDVVSEIITRSTSDPNGIRLGRFSGRICLRQLPTAHSSLPSRLLTAAAGETQPFPHFEFLPLDKPVDWSRLVQHVDSDDILERNDANAIKDLLVYGKNLHLGATQLGRGDAAVRNAFQLQQLQLQYISYTCDTLRSREDSIRSALRCFDVEEESLDGKIARLRARARLLQKQCRTLDQQQEKYANLLGDKVMGLVARAAAKLEGGEGRGDVGAQLDGLSDDEAVYTVEEYNQLHKKPFLKPSESLHSEKIHAKDTHASNKKAANASPSGCSDQKSAEEKVDVRPTPHQAIVREHEALVLPAGAKDSSDDDSVEDIQSILAERKALSNPPSPAKQPGRELSPDSSNSDIGGRDTSVSAVNSPTRDDMDVRASQSELGESADEEVPIALSWLPPKHSGAMASRTAGSTWVSAGVRSSLGSTGMSQDSLNQASSRPQTAQSAVSAMSTDSLNVVRNPEVTSATSSKPNIAIKSPQPQISKIIREWQTNRSPTDSDISDLQSKPNENHSGDDSDADPSFVNANITKDDSRMEEPVARKATESSDVAVTEWKDVSAVRSPDAPVKVLTSKQLQALYEKAALRDLEDSGLDVSIDNDEDVSPGFPRNSSGERSESREDSMKSSDAKSYSQSSFVDITHISSPDDKGRWANNTDSMSADGSKNVYARERESDGKGDADQASAFVSEVVDISYTDDDFLTAQDKMSTSMRPPTAKESNSATRSSGMAFKESSPSHSVKNNRSKQTTPTSKTPGQNMDSYEGSPFYETSIDEYMGTSRPSSRGPGMYGDFSQHSSPFDHAGDSQVRGAVLNETVVRASPVVTTSPGTGIDSFRDDSKTVSVGIRGSNLSSNTSLPVKYTRHSSKEDFNASKETMNTDHAPPGIRTQVLRVLQSQSEAKHSVNTQGSNGEDALDYGYGQANTSSDDVLLGTQCISPRTLTAIASVDHSDGFIDQSSPFAADVPDHYKSMERLKGLLGGSDDAASTANARIPKQVSGTMNSSANVGTMNEPVWLPGRCTIDAIENGTGLDLLVSAIQLNRQISKNSRTEAIQLQFSFLGQTSEKSSSFDLKRATGSADQMLLPTQYSAHLGPGANGPSLRSEIETEEEGLSIVVFVRDATTGENIGRANVNIWIMVEDACQMIRHEIDVFSISSHNGVGEGVLIGSIYVDVRGYRLLLNHYSP